MTVGVVIKSIPLSVGLNILQACGIWPGGVNGGRSYVLVDWDSGKKIITPRIGSVVEIIRFSGNPFDPMPIPVTYTDEALSERFGTVLEEK